MDRFLYCARCVASFSTHQWSWPGEYTAQPITCLECWMAQVGLLTCLDEAQAEDGDTPIPQRVHLHVYTGGEVSARLSPFVIPGNGLFSPA